MQSYTSFLERRELQEVAVLLVNAGVDVPAFCENLTLDVRKARYKCQDAGQAANYVSERAGVRLVESVSRHPSRRMLNEFLGIGKAFNWLTGGGNKPQPQPQPQLRPVGGGGPKLRPIMPNHPANVRRGTPYAAAVKGDPKEFINKYNMAITHLEQLQQMLSTIPGPSGRPLQVKNLQQVTNFVRKARAAFQANPVQIMQAFKTGKPILDALPADDAGGGGANQAQPATASPVPQQVAPGLGSGPLVGGPAGNGQDMVPGVIGPTGVPIRQKPAAVKTPEQELKELYGQHGKDPQMAGVFDSLDPSDPVKAVAKIKAELAARQTAAPAA